MAELVRSTPIQLLALLAVLVVAGVVRLYALTERGLIYWDEAKFALEGIRFQAILQHALGVHVPLYLGKTVGTAKPTHAALIAAMYAVFGVRDFAPLFLSAVAGVAEVGLVYVIGRRLFSPLVGLTAAILLATSPYDVIYARSALSETDGTALLLLGVVVWLRTWQRPPRSDSRTMVDPTGNPFLAGLVLGLAFTTNYRLILYIGTLVGFDLLWSAATSGWTTVKRLLVWPAGLMVPLLVWQAVDLLARSRGVVLFREEVSTQIGTTPQWYLEQVVYRLEFVKFSRLRLGSLQTVWFVSRQGWIMLALLAIGMALVIWRHSFPWLAMAALVVVPFVGAMLAPYVVARTLQAAVPFVLVLAGAVLVTAAGAIPWPRLSLSLLAIVVLAASVAEGRMSWPLTAERSGFARAAAYVERHGGGKALTSSEVMVYYLRGSGPRCFAPRPPRIRGDLAKDFHAGYHYAVFDYHAHGYLSEVIRQEGTLVARYSATGPVPGGQDLIRAEDSSAPNHVNLNRVDVYSLSSVSMPPASGEFIDRCNRDHTN